MPCGLLARFARYWLRFAQLLATIRWLLSRFAPYWPCGLLAPSVLLVRYAHYWRLPRYGITLVDYDSDSTVLPCDCCFGRPRSCYGTPLAACGGLACYLAHACQ